MAELANHVGKKKDTEGSYELSAALQHGDAEEHVRRYINQELKDKDDFYKAREVWVLLERVRLLQKVKKRGASSVASQHSRQ